MQIKAAADRQPDIIAMGRLLDRPDVPAATRTRIEAELRNVRAGEKGEREAAYEIELYFGRAENWATIHDFRFEVDGLAAQIDHLIINRLAEVWVCESKSFAEGVSINEYGEWSRWWHGRREGMPSPIEQNRRHIHLLERVFDEGLAPLPRRLGLARMRPRLRSLVLVSDNARISRPRRKVDGIDQIIKAEQLRTRLLDAFDASPITDMARLIGKEQLANWAKDIAALHRPTSVDWTARFGLPSEPTPPGPSPRPLSPAFRESVRPRCEAAGACIRCGREVSQAVMDYCAVHADEFGGALYCMRCQPEVRAKMERPVVVPVWANVLARYRAPMRLQTVARQAPFIIVASGSVLRVTPDSSERVRTLTQADFEHAASLLGRQGRGEVNEASRNSSYVEAILADIARDESSW